MQLIDGGGFECPPEERGDCFRACVASILELDAEALPNPHDQQHWGEAWNRELAKIGIRPLWLEEWQGNWFPGYWIACIPSRNIEGNHCVVMRGREFVHDPSNGKRVTRVDLGEVGEAVILLPHDPSGSVKAPTEPQKGME